MRADPFRSERGDALGSERADALEREPPVHLWLTLHEWRDLSPGDISGTPPLSVARDVLASAEAVVDVVVRTTDGTVRVGARLAVCGPMGVQLARVRAETEHGVGEGVRLSVFPVALLPDELADLVPDVPDRSPQHPARHPAEYPFDLFLAGLTAAAPSHPEAVLAEICTEISRNGSLPAEVAARQLTHLGRECSGRLEAVVRPGRGAALRPRAGPDAVWTRTSSGWFSLTPGRPAGPLGRRPIAVRPVRPHDLADAVGPALASCLTAAQPRPSGTARPPAR